MAYLREVLERAVAGAKTTSARLRTGKVRNDDQSRPGRNKWYRSGTVALVGIVTVMSSAAGAWAYSSTTGWTSGAGLPVGTGNGLVLTEFYSYGQNATYRSKWLGAYNPSMISSNTPGAVNTDLWCIESGVAIPGGYAYSWTTDSNPRARYLMWLSTHSWNNPDARGAIQYLLYADAYPGLGQNNTGTSYDYESRIWNHPDFTAAAKSYVNAFHTLSTAQMHNSAVHLTTELTGTKPTKGRLDGIGVTDAWGNYIAGLSYTITSNGPGVFDATGTATISGTTAGSLINDAHNWTATGAGNVSFTITYASANVGGTVYVGSGSGSQDMVAGSGFSNLTSDDPAVPVEFMFQPGGATQVPAASVAPGDTLVDTFTPAAIGGTTWPIDAGAYVPVTYDWAVYDAGEVIPGAPVAAAPGDWTLLETTQVIATAPGTPITSNFTVTAQAGHAYVFVVSFSNSHQPPATQGWFVANWSDQYGVADEIVYAPAAAAATSTASSEGRGSDTAILDSVTFTGFPSDHGAFAGRSPFAADTTTVRQRLYFFPEGLAVTDANTSSANLMCDLTVPATNGAHAIDAPCAIAQKDTWGQYMAGTYVWTSTFTGDARVRAFATSVTDTEEQVHLAPTSAAATSTASSEGRGSDTAILDSVTFTGFPSDHATGTGRSPFAADTTTMRQRLYFFPEGLAVTDANTGSASLMCDLTVPATNGAHAIDDPCAIAQKDTWGQYVAGTYAWTSTFVGDARVRAFATSVTDTAEQVTFANQPLAVTTTAHEAADLFTGVAGDVWDTATVTGFVPVGSTIKFALYRFDDAATPVCDADTLLATLDPVDALMGAGSYLSERFTLTTPDAAAVGFVETIYDASGAVLSQGDCGATTETLPIIRADSGGGGGGGGLALTGADHFASNLAFAGILLLGGGVLVGRSVYIRRRRSIA